jgi:hypothetical protein
MKPTLYYGQTRYLFRPFGLLHFPGHYPTELIFSVFFLPGKNLKGLHSTYFCLPFILSTRPEVFRQHPVPWQTFCSLHLSPCPV